MANNDIPYIDWQSSNLAETFKLIKQWLELYFVVDKIKTEQVNYILLRVGNEGLKKYNMWLLTEEEKRTPEIIFNKFIEQLEPKENFRINRLKLMTYKQEAEELSDDFVNRCRQMTQRCSLTEREQQQWIIELIMTSTSIADFQKELLRKDNTLTLEETVSIGKTYEASNIHIKQLRAMVNNNNVYNTNIQAIRTPTCSTMSNNCLIRGKSHAFHRETCPAFGSKCNTCGKANHWA